MEFSGESTSFAIDLVQRVTKDLKSDFDRNHRILSFDEYLHHVERQPRLHLRGSAQYLLDVMDYYGVEEKSTASGAKRFKLFDMEFSDAKYRVVNQHHVHEEIHQSLKKFVKDGINNKLILLHGPNGSAKSSIVNCLMAGMEDFSTKPEGALYRFNWVFPVDKYTKQGLGLSGTSPNKTGVTSFAKLPEEEITARVPCELKDHPLLLLPRETRARILESLQTKMGETLIPDYLTKGALCQKCHEIFEALLLKYKGDLSKVLMHAQVERFYVSKRYRNSAVSIEPQMHVDAQSRQLTADRSLAFLPSALQYISLYEVLGDIPDGNRGIIDYADLLKRPVDAFKYLLTACEQGSVNVGSSIVYLDAIWLGSTNELQMDAFKEFPDFVSFKARIELVRVPYILAYSEEQKIYDVQLHKIAGDKHITPHTTFIAALWAVLTRLKKPNASHYPAAISDVLGSLTPLEKAKLYDHTEMPPNLTADQKKYLKAAIPRLRDEYSSVPYYEGRMGASARELKTVLHDAAQNAEFRCLSPLAVFQELESLVRKITEYEFLKQEVRDGYHDHAEFIQTVRKEYLNRIDIEVRESMGLFERGQYEEYLKKYVLHMSHLMKKEKIKNSITGKMENPDAQLLEEFENIVGAPRADKELEAFRQNVISSIGAYSLDHPQGPVNYRNVFPEFMEKLENHYFEQQKALMSTMHDALLFFDNKKAKNEIPSASSLVEVDVASMAPANDLQENRSESLALAKKTIVNMVQKFSYCPDCAKSTILFLVKARY